MNIITIPIEKVIAIIKQIRKKSDALDAVPRSEVPVQTFLNMKTIYSVTMYLLGLE